MNERTASDFPASPLPDLDREALTSSSLRQDEAHVKGAYDYLNGVDMCARYGCIAAYVLALRRHDILDLGCGIGSLRLYLDPGVLYHGIDVSPSAIARARSRLPDSPNTTLECVDIRNMTGRDRAYDCVVWAGIGHAFGRTGGEDEEGWREVLDMANGVIGPGGLLILETIVGYEAVIARVIAGYRFVNSWQVSCSNGPVHSRRMGWVLRGLHETTRGAAKS